MSDDAAWLLPANSTPLERDLTNTTARAGRVPVPIRQLWNPDTCPVELLPWLAWALAVDVWDSDWPENLKRSRIRDSIKIHRHKGSVKSVRDVVHSFGSSLTLKEWWQTSPKGDPYTFQIVLVVGSSVPQTAKFQNQIMQAVELTMPVRCQYTLLLGLSAEASVGAVSAAQAVTYRRLNLAD